MNGTRIPPVHVAAMATLNRLAPGRVHLGVGTGNTATRSMGQPLRMAELIASNRKFCVQKTGSALLQQWLASYQGRNFPVERRWCKPGDKTWDVIRYRQQLLKELARANLKRRATPKIAAK